jgi:transposase
MSLLINSEMSPIIFSGGYFMTKEIISMSYKELDRLQIIRESVSRHITQEQAAGRIGVSVRQVKRLVQRFRTEGPQGLVSRRRGKRPNNAFTPEFRAHVISLSSEKNIRILVPPLLVKNYKKTTVFRYQRRHCVSGWLRKGYGGNVAEKLPVFTRGDSVVHATVN